MIIKKWRPRMHCPSVAGPTQKNKIVLYGQNLLMSEIRWLEADHIPEWINGYCNTLH